MTNVAEKTDLKKLIEDFIITEVIEDDWDHLTVMGESDDLYAKVSKHDVLRLHGGTTGYVATRDCDRGNSFHISPEDLWEDGSDEGRPVNMVAEVWGDLNKEWVDEDGSVVMKEKRYDKGRVAVYEQDAKAKHSWEGIRSNDAEVQKLIDHGFWISSVGKNTIRAIAYGQTEPINDKSFPQLMEITPFTTKVVACFKRSA